MGPVLTLWAVVAHAQETDLTSQIEATQARIEQMRGLSFTSPVEVRRQTEDQLRDAIRTALVTELSPEVAHAMEQALFAFGLVDDAFDVRASFIAILTEQVAGYYDPQTRELYVIDRPMDAPDAVPEVAAAMVTEHELVHALQDQHFDLWALTEREYFNDDVAIAIRSLVEGDATWVMVADTVSALGLDPDTMELSALIRQLGDPSQGSGPALAAAPPVLTRGLILPYAEGPRLVEKLRQVGGWTAVDAAFAAPPLSTEQVLHPERYLTDTPDWPTALTLPDLEGALPGWSWLYANTMGELQTRVLLETYAADVSVKAAEGWDGDRYAIYERRGTPALIWLTTWDTPRDAEEFAAAARRFAATRYPAKRWRVEARDLDVLVIGGLKPKPAAAATDAVFAGTSRAEHRTPDDIAPPPAPRP